MAKSSTAVATRTVAELLRSGEAPVESSETRALIAQSIAQSTLNAETLDDVFNEGSGSKNAEDMIGRPIEVQGIMLRESQIEGQTSYLLINAVDLTTGELVVINTSATKVVAQLARAEELKGFPLKVELYQMGQGRQGESAPVACRLVK